MALLETQKNERRQRILAAARTMLETHGYEGVTMRALADESRVSVPTLYNLFGGKDPLLLAAVEERFNQLLASASHTSRHRGLERCLAVLEAMNRQLAEAPRYSRSMIQMFLLAPNTRLTSARMAAALGVRLGEVLRELAGEGLLASWAEPGALAQRMTSHYLASVMTWASTPQNQATLEAVTLYEAACTLMSAAADERDRARLQKRARKAQPLVLAAFGQGIPPAMLPTQADESA